MNTYISSYTSRRVVIATAVALMAIACVAMSAAPAAAQVWTEQDAGTTADFETVDCPSADVCYAGSPSGGVFKTTDGGDTWTSIAGPGASSLSCPTELDCYAAAESSISQTTDGGGSWSSTGWVSQQVNDLHCPTTDLCIAGLKFRYGANVMIAQGSNVRHFMLTGGYWNSAPDVLAVDCPSALRCIAAGYPYAWWTDALPGVYALGDDWTGSFTNDVRGSGSSADLACPTELTCYGASRWQAIDVTRDGGLTWVEEADGNVMGGATLAISCSRPTTCVSGGEYGMISQTTTGGAWVQTRNHTNLDGILYGNSSKEVIRGLSCPVGLTCTAVGDDGLILSQGRASL